MGIQVHKSQRIQNRINQDKTKQIHIINKLSKVKEKENLKEGREKWLLIYNGTPTKLSGFFNRNLVGQDGVDDIFEVQKKSANQEYYIQKKCLLKIKKDSLSQAQSEGVYHNQTCLQEMLKGVP